MSDARPAEQSIREAFAATDLWIFDLDNTLYPAECNLFRQVDRRMSEFIQDLLSVGPDQARRIQKTLYYEHGTTLSGLMLKHDVKPEAFLDYVHDIDLTPVPESPRLAAALEKLSGRRFIFTNGSTRHAERVAEKLGVLHLFDGIFDIAAGGYIPKPKPEAFARFMAFCKGVGCKGAMFEDLPHNLEAAHALSLTTVLVQSSYRDHPSQHALRDAGSLPHYINFETSELAAFLETIIGRTSGEQV